MTPDEAGPLDDALLAKLLAADAALAAGEEPDSLSETVNTLELDHLAGYMDVLRRLGHRRTTAESDVGEAASPPLPLRLGRFEILGRLGQGGFGVVYLAYDPTLGREVALKVPRPEVLITPDVRRRFLREARAAAGLDHPNIVGVYEVGEAGPVCYIAATYCAGPTLSEWLKARTEPTPPRLAATFLVSLSDAVQHAHDRGILHRDIKPSNVILTGGRSQTPPIAGGPAEASSLATVSPRGLSQGQAGNDEPLAPRLADFGLARIAEEAGDETRSGVPLGSPPYMAPEQAAGRNREVGPATDVYALGATLYEIMTGRAPYRGETPAETLQLVLEAGCVSPRALRPGLPRDLETICLKCLEKDPARRYPSARALRDDLVRYLDHQPIQARPVSIRQRVRRWARLHPMGAGLTLLAVSLAAGMLGATAYRNMLLEDHARQLEREVARADANAQIAQRHLHVFHIRQASEALAAHQVERAQDILRSVEADQASARAGRPGALGFARRYLMSQARRNLVVLSDRQAERVSVVALSEDGRTFVTGDFDGTILPRDPETGRPSMRLTGHKKHIDLLAVSADGKRLLSVGQPSQTQRVEVFLWDLVEGRLLSRLDGFSKLTVQDARFDRQGGRLWVVSLHDSDGPKLDLWDVAADPLRPRLIWRKPLRTAHFPVSRDGSIFALEEQERRVAVRDLESGRELGRTPQLKEEIRLAVPSPDGRLLAIGGTGEASLWDVSAGRESHRFKLSQHDLASISFSAGGHYLALVFSDGEIVVRDLQTGARHSIPAAADPVSFISVVFSRDDRLLMTNVSSTPGHSPPTVVRQLDPWRTLATYPGKPGTTRRPVFTADGSAAVLALDHTLFRWTLSPAPEAGQPGGHADEAWSLAFSGDGSVLASGSDDTDETQTIKLWDVNEGRLIRGWNAGVGTVGALAFHPKSRLLASGHLVTSGDVRLWDASTGERLANLTGHTADVRALAFSPDGNFLATAGSDFKVRLWDVARRECVQVLSDHTDTVASVSFSPDGGFLASAGNDRTIRVWELARRRATTLSWVEKFSTVAFAPDGSSLAAADERGRVTMWDLKTASRVQTIDTEDHELRCLAFSRDGSTLATGGKSQVIRLWDPVTGQQLFSLEGHKAQIHALAFAPGDLMLASCSHDGAVRLWRATPNSSWRSEKASR